MQQEQNSSGQPNGGPTSDPSSSHAFYKSVSWRALRTARLQRDGNRCTERFCTTPTDRLTAHHIMEAARRFERYRGQPAHTLHAMP